MCEFWFILSWSTGRLQLAMYWVICWLLILSNSQRSCCCCCCCVTSVVSDSVQPHRWQPTRLLCPQDSLGKNTGVGCHFLLQWTGMLCVFKAWQLSVISILTSLVFDTPWFWSLIVIVVHYLNENFDIIYCLSSSKYHFSVLVKILGKTFQKQHSNASSLTIMCIS